MTIDRTNREGGGGESLLRRDVCAQWYKGALYEGIGLVRS